MNLFALLHLGCARAGAPTSLLQQYILVFAATTPASTLIVPASAVTTDSKCAFVLIVVGTAVVVTIKFPSEANPGATQPISIRCCSQLRWPPVIYVLYFVGGCRACAYERFLWSPRARRDPALKITKRIH